MSCVIELDGKELSSNRQRQYRGLCAEKTKGLMRAAADRSFKTEAVAPKARRGGPATDRQFSRCTIVAE